jgi:hypothetical protein
MLPHFHHIYITLMRILALRKQFTFVGATKVFQAALNVSAASKMFLMSALQPTEMLSNIRPLVRDL